MKTVKRDADEAAEEPDFSGMDMEMEQAYL